MTAALSYLSGIDAVVAVDDHDVDAFFRDEPGDAEAVVEQALAEAGQQTPPAPSRLLKIELASVSDADWTRFVLAMKTAAVDSVSGSCALGAWEMRPRRLVDLGLMTNLHSVKTPLGRRSYDGDFIGDVDPERSSLTRKMFLENQEVQYLVFATSMRRYVDRLTDGSIEHGQADPNMTLSGALAILHRCGPNGLAKWGDESARFSDTVDLYNRVNGLF